ncbi:hypothetical protein J7E71_16140 [Mesobacillus foraminis]|uniref:hypothetical protein n=1 Tax=Mesobacillus foraminis TaxID=279826 RepID=UPI001BE94EC9|nr:hypothetical protein [Mesobacillus foraminis]MBT2757454.1 hypothetical protein [Mesobacillus foraminis]
MYKSKFKYHVFKIDKVVYKEGKTNKQPKGLVKLKDLTATSTLLLDSATEAAFAERVTGTLVLNRYT